MQFKTTIIIVLLSLFKLALFAQNPFIKGEKRRTVEIDKQKYVLIQGHFDVPEDHEKPQGRILKLPIRIYKSNNPNPLEPIFWLNGGPGASNLFHLSYAEFLANHDIIIIGYRGTDGNTILNSKRLSKAMKGKNHQLLSDASLDNAATVFKHYADDLARKGIDYSKYTMMEVIEDVEFVRKALEIRQINFYSISYGTRIALLYGYKYPENIKRSVMVGANPPGHFVWYPDKTEQILDTYDSLYKAQNLPDYQGSIKEAMRISFAKMPKKWSMFRLDKDKIKAMTFGILFSVDGAAMVFDAYFKASKKGDYSGLYLLQLFFDIGMSKTDAWGDMYAKGLSADFEKGKNYRSWLRSFDKTTTLGANYSLLLWGVADGWDPYLIPAEYRQLRESDTQTLILSGNLDVSTPADFATEKLLPSLKNGRQVILNDYSHAMTGNFQKEALREMIAHYFETGEVNDSAIKYQPIDFKPKKSLTKMAKRGYPLWMIMQLIY